MRVVLFAVASLAFALCGNARAQTAAYTEEHLALAREVVQLSGGAEMLTQMFDLMAPQMAEQIVAAGGNREFANRFVEVFREEFTAETPRILELTSIGYAGALTLEELRDVRDFYASPSGRALVTRSQDLAGAMTQAGERIGQEAAQRAIARMEAEGGLRRENP